MKCGKGSFTIEAAPVVYLAAKLYVVVPAPVTPAIEV